MVSLLKDPQALKCVYDKIIIFSSTFRTQYERLWSKLDSTGITVFEDLNEEVLIKLYQDQLGSSEHVCVISDDMDEQWRKDINQQLLNKIITNSATVVFLSSSFVKNYHKFLQ